ncbi:MAG: ABC transporter permease [Chloroflexota bacterium]
MGCTGDGPAVSTAGAPPVSAVVLMWRPWAGRHPWAVSTLSLLSVVVIWALASALIDSKVLLPSPIAVGTSAVIIARTSFQGASLWQDVWVSTLRVLTGYLVGVGVGLAIGFVIAMSRVMKAMIDPLIELVRPVPPLAWIPLLVVWFGIGEFPKILLLVMAATPIMAIATAGAIGGVRRDLEMSARSLGASSSQVMLHVVLPASLPGILTGARIATAACWSSLVAVEMIASQSGLGWLIWQASSYLQTAVVFVGILLIAAIALSLDRLLRLLEARLVPWKGKV